MTAGLVEARSVSVSSGRLQIQRLPDGTLRVVEQASRREGYYRPDGTYARGDLRATTLRALLGGMREEGR